MSPNLSIEDFEGFFQEVHGYLPFPWQARLARQVTKEGKWPDVLDLPTGSGKTAALDVAVFHLALEADRGSKRRGPVRIALVVDRRLVVDDAFSRAKRISKALREAKPESAAGRVADRLRLLAGEGNPPLLARRLRGGIPREDDWARTPSQPTILCSTVDQVGSRLLFRGYGVSDSMKPVHAGLLGSDCFIMLDEAHLSEPFRQTLRWVEGYKSQSWRESIDAAPWGVALLTATPGEKPADSFGYTDDDQADVILGRRWVATKPARLIEISKPGLKNAEAEEPFADAKNAGKAEEKLRATSIVREAVKGLEAMQSAGLSHPALAVVVNRVARAREVFEGLRKALGVEDVDSVLMIGPSRSVERDALADVLKPIRTGKDRGLKKPLVIVSTQCIEVGVDIDLDGLITEAAPLDALRQRFGRLNRNGREGVQAYAAVVGGARADAKDPVYGEATANTWKYLIDAPDEPARKGKDPKQATVDFGLEAFEAHLKRYPLPSPVDLKDLLSPKPDAPVLLPAHLDLLSQTSPIPTTDPEVSLYLHGPSRAADAVTVIWRADVSPEPREDRDSRTRRLLLLIPPRAAEAIELPVWAVRAWLQKAELSALADIPGPDEERLPENVSTRGLVFRWAGDDDRSSWIDPAKIRPGNTIVIPASYGGVDQFGWNPDAKPAIDVADKAAAPFAGRRFVVRVAPGLLKNPADDAQLSRAIESAETRQWEALRDAVKSVGLPDTLAEGLDRLESAKGTKRKNRVQAYTDLYGDEDGCPRGVVFVAPFGIETPKNEEAEEGSEEGGSSNATEDDIAGSLPGFALSLERHSNDVEAMVERFVRTNLAGVPEDRICDLKLAAHLHDAGKADLRFQAWLAYGDPLGPDPSCPGEILAKSARPIPRNARASSGLPDRWRHEALSVRLAPSTPRFAEAKDPELVLWLIGTHHGHGRPFFPHSDPADAKPRNLPFVPGIGPMRLCAGSGPQSLAYDREGLDWPGLYERLKVRYGVWELARMEAVLRLADHRASEEAGRSDGADEGGLR